MKETSPAVCRLLCAGFVPSLCPFSRRFLTCPWLREFLPPIPLPVQHFQADIQVASGVLNFPCSSRKHWPLFFWLGGVSSWVTSSHAPSVCSVPSSSQLCVNSLGPGCGCLIYTTEPSVLFPLCQMPRVGKLLGSLWFLKLPGSIPSQHSQVICFSFSGAVIPGMSLNCSTLALNGAALKTEAKQSVATDNMGSSGPWVNPTAISLPTSLQWFLMLQELKMGSVTENQIRV